MKNTMCDEDKSKVYSPFTNILGALGRKNEDDGENCFVEDKDGINFLPVIIDRESVTDGVILPHLVDMICTTVLPSQTRDIKFPGHGQSVLFIDTDHKLKTDDISTELGDRVSKVAQEYFRTLPKKDRATMRITSKEQFQIVRKAMERIIVLEVFNPLSFELAIAGLHRMLKMDSNISLVIISSINTFFHQVTQETGVHSLSYLRKLLGLLADSCSTWTNSTGGNASLHCLYTQHNYFNTREDRFYEEIRETDKLAPFKHPLYINKEEEGNPKENSSYIHTYKGKEMKS